ncbi:MAG: hypothetical protein ABIT05_05135 [Chitinophagaceae bacterium]
MNKREKLLRSKTYLVSQIQLGLLNLIGNYKDKKKLKDYQLANELGVSKGYVSQILNATYDHKISKVVELSLACNAVPITFFVPLEEYVQYDQEDKIYQIFPVIRPRLVDFEAKIEVSTEVKKSVNIFKGSDSVRISAQTYQFSLV